MATLAPETPAIYAEQAAVRPSSPMSDVKGHVFDRIVQIWLENVDYHVCLHDNLVLSETNRETGCCSKR